MLNLVLAIAGSAMVSIVMRLSSNRVKANVGMLAANYLTCLILAGSFCGGRFFPDSAALPRTLALGSIHGFLYLLSFVMFQYSVKKNGVVLPAIFMKLGLLVPMVVSVLLFGEMPSAVQAVGFLIAVAGIILVNFEKRDAGARPTAGLLLLLLSGGAADAMSKVFEQMGDSSLAPQFLLYTFMAALVLCLGLMIFKKQRPGRPELLYGFLIGIPNFFSARFLLAALNTVPAVIAYPTYSVATILAVTMAGIGLFRERLNRRQWLAIGVILVALVLLNI